MIMMIMMLMFGISRLWWLSVATPHELIGARVHSSNTSRLYQPSTFRLLTSNFGILEHQTLEMLEFKAQHHSIKVGVHQRL